MIVRKLRLDEMYKATAISSVAFEYGLDYQKEKEKAEKMEPKEEKALPENPQPSDYFQEETWGALSDDESTVYGVVTVPVYTARFDGVESLLGGIGGVSTLPPYRRMGAIRECMRSILGDLNEKGFDFSYLYPFSTAYYRKFGYENSCEIRQWELDFKALGEYGSKGRIKMLLPGDDFSPLTKVYNQFYRDYNLSVIRREYRQKLGESKLLEEMRYVYVWENEAGEARGFLIFRNGNGVMDCTIGFENGGDLLALDREAYMALFDFARTFAPNYYAIRFTAPSCLRLDTMLHETTQAKCKVFHPGMARVVNVERVLKKCRCKGKGTLQIHISDPMAPWNTGCWRLSFGEENHVEKSFGPADIEMTINAFTALICGDVDFQDVEFLPGVKILREEAPFSQVFYKKKSAISDLF